MKRLLICLLLLSSTYCFAQSDSELEKYIQQLGHEDYTVREHAEQQIIRAGAQSIPLLKKALESGDAEISWRAETLLEEINTNIKEGGSKQNPKPLPKKEPFSEIPETEEEHFEMRPLQKSTKSFFSGSFTIFKNGNRFEVQTLSDGSFKIFTEEVNANGKKETNSYTFLNEDEFQEKNPELYKRYKKASEGITFERIAPKIKTPFQNPNNSSGGFDFSFGNSGFDSSDMSDISDILQELFQNDGQIDINRILQKQSTQRLMDRFLDSMAEDDPQLQQMLEMQRQMMKQFGLLGNDENNNTFGGQTTPRKPNSKRVSPPAQKDPKKTFEQTMEAYSFPGLELAAMTDALQSQLREKGVIVAKAEDQAQAAGLKKFDIILSINGYETQSPEDALKIISKLKKGETATFQLIRKLQRTSISFTF